MILTTLISYTRKNFYDFKIFHPLQKKLIFQE